jgi:hypothetical protein
MGTHAEVMFYDGIHPNEGEPNKPIVFYQHYDGYNIQHVVADALFIGQDRWSDPPYLARIIFTQMTNQTDDNTLGFGISHDWGCADNQHIVKVFCRYNEDTYIRFREEDYTPERFMRQFSPKYRERIENANESNILIRMHDMPKPNKDAEIVEGSWTKIT